MQRCCGDIQRFAALIGPPNYYITSKIEDHGFKSQEDEKDVFTMEGHLCHLYFEQKDYTLLIYNSQH